MPKIAIVGGYWGREEEAASAAFVGYSGHELTRMLSEAGIDRYRCLLTNVFNIFKPGGDDDLSLFSGPKAEAIHGYPPINSKYIHRRFIPELERLGDEIAVCDPNIIIALGNIALWALCGHVAITKYRGVACVSTHTAIGYKVLPTYNPAAIVRQWYLRPTMVLDLQKAQRESEFPDLRRPQRKIFIPETVEDLRDFAEIYIRAPGPVSVDIETFGKVITCIGFAPNARVGIVVPFTDIRRDDRTYWASPADERAVWTVVRGILADRRIKKVFQNGLYDISFLWRGYGIPTYGAEEDVMLLHHALQPESLKSLGFLGSIYTDEGPWKHMRSATIKQD